MSPVEVLAYVDRSGGRVWLEGGRLKYRLPEGRQDLLEALKANKDQIIGFLERTKATSTSAVTMTRLEAEPIAAEPEDGYELLPAESPWLELGDSAQGIWDALEAQGTRTLHLIDQDGRKACHSFTASKTSDLKELARRGLKTFPRIKRLTVIAVLPEVQIWQLEPRTVN